MKLSDSLDSPLKNFITSPESQFSPFKVTSYIRELAQPANLHTLLELWESSIMDCKELFAWKNSDGWNCAGLEVLTKGHPTKDVAVRIALDLIKF